MTRRHLDQASTTLLRPEARAAMIVRLDHPAADPSRLHAEALEARMALEVAREQVATLLGARPREVVFTSGGTEAVATAVWGAADRGRHLVVSAVEHSCVLDAAQALAAAGTHDLTVVEVDGTGRIDPAAVAAVLRPDTCLVAVQAANHEVGTLQPIEAVAATLEGHGALLLVDAAMAAGHVPLSFRALGADLLAVSAHKLGGPPGVGALLIRRGLRLRPLLLGGDQERARRAGLEDLPAAAGFGAAAEALDAPCLTAERSAAERRTDRLRTGISAIDGVAVVGHPEHRLPHIVCATIDDVEPQAVLLGLDRAGIAAHSGSACSSESLEPSPVLAAMGLDAHRSLRLSVGWATTDDDVDAVLTALPGLLADLRSLR
jgi:cysteine desulfurase